MRSLFCRGAQPKHTTRTCPTAPTISKLNTSRQAAAALALTKSARVLVLLTVPFGVNAQQLDIPFTLSLNPSTQALVLRDLVLSLEPHNIRKLVILNGHGGTDFRAMIRELRPATRIFLCAANWHQPVPAGEYFDEARRPRG
jgi:creatinine amidohydrolase